MDLKKQILMNLRNIRRQSRGQCRGSGLTLGQQQTLQALDGVSTTDYWRCCPECGEQVDAKVESHCGRAVVVMILRQAAKEEVWQGPPAVPVRPSDEITIPLADAKFAAWS